MVRALTYLLVDRMNSSIETIYIVWQRKQQRGDPLAS